MKIFTTILFCLFLGMGSAQASGRGSGVRGGGVAEWIDGQWQLHEVFTMDSGPGVAMRLSPAMKKIIQEDVQPLVELYTGTQWAEYWHAVLGDEADYRLVDELPCESNGERLGENQAVYGCTIGNTTYFVKEVFSAFDNPSKILAVLHERGHALDPSDTAHDWIAPFVASVNLLLRLSAEQERGSWRVLEAREILLLDRLTSDPKILRWLNRGGRSSAHPKYRVVSGRGGGLILSSSPVVRREIRIDDTSFLSVGSVLVVSPNRCLLTNEEAREFVWVGAQSKIWNSWVECTRVTETLVTDSTIRRLNSSGRASGVNTFTQSSIRNSKLETSSLIALDVAQISDTEIYYSSIHPGWIREAEVRNVVYMYVAPARGPTDVLDVSRRNVVYSELTRVGNDVFLRRYQ